jgi:arginyl-tRNA synthetase
VIPGDIGAELAGAISAAVAAAELPAAAQTRADAAGTWRPAPRGAGGGPGTYATTLPFLLAEASGLGAAEIAVLLAARLGRIAWISSASVTGNGYLTIAVTRAALAQLAVRVAQAGDSCARSTALRGLHRDAPADADLASAASWPQAWRQVTGATTGRLAAAAGATVKFKTNTKRDEHPNPAAPASPVPGVGAAAAAVTGSPEAVRRAGAAGRGGGAELGAGPGGAAGRGGEAELGAGPGGAAGRGGGAELGAGPVAAAVAFAGSDAIRYALARTRTGGIAGIDAGSSVKRVLGNPYFAVCFCHADAVSTLRWAADLGLRLGEPGEFVPGLLGQDAERELLDEISWLPERVAGPARRGQPEEFARYLEGLAGAYLDCRESCPALPFMGQSAPADAAVIRARLWLAAAAGAALGAGLRLLGVAAPERV